jgi:hypothetical protein
LLSVLKLPDRYNGKLLAEIDPHVTAGMDFEGESKYQNA